ncbi:S8 family peptidase [Actinokineospora sp. NBRC 105648]|uniref:S8 family peptidase n=1 Tax=Actinokineospora sp. NBRC 105648 TaxID=3032206 RepID=UPI0024A1CCD4|nr:S8 family peptidase [Actinokineospora sp. NBRC 105648]GLZ39740.1 hypothetical protein Acsp05_33640 [Actinokineospora sp. NBRC 105648]
MRQDRNFRRVAAAGGALGAAALAVLAAVTIPASANEAAPAQQPTPSGVLSADNAIPGSYIVVFKDGSSVASATGTTATDLAQRYGAKVKLTYTASIRGFAGELSAEQAKRLAADPAVAYVQQDSTVTVNETQPNPTWGLDRVDQRDLPLSNGYTYSTTASNVNAYIIDTGVLTTHPEFEGRAKHGYDAVDKDNDATDCNGHGTHVAGTIGSKTYGVAKKVNLFGVRVLPCSGSGPNSNVIAGIDWVAKNAAKPAVANLSLGGGADTASDDAIKRLIQAGVTVAVAAGNDNKDACNYSPARVPDAITVGATTKTDSRALPEDWNKVNGSNYGTCLDIFAPGTGVTSTWLDNGTNSISGTSMATPHVAGVAALYLAANPNATNQQVRDALVNNATSGKVTNLNGSPNKLLYSVFDGTPTTTPTSPTSTTRPTTPTTPPTTTTPPSTTTTRPTTTTKPNSTVTVFNPGQQFGFVGHPANYSVYARSSDGSALTYAATGLPTGLTIDARTGRITGTYTRAGTYSVTVTATNTSGATGTATFSWRVL